MNWVAGKKRSQPKLAPDSYNSEQSYLTVMAAMLEPLE